MAGFVDWQNGIRDSDLPPTTKLVAYVLSTYMGFDDGQCFPSRSTLAQKVGRSVSTVSRATRRLEEAGWIEKWRRLDSTNLYRRKLPDEPTYYWKEGDDPPE